MRRNVLLAVVFIALVAGVFTSCRPTPATPQTPIAPSAQTSAPTPASPAHTAASPAATPAKPPVAAAPPAGTVGEEAIVPMLEQIGDFSAPPHARAALLQQLRAQIPLLSTAALQRVLAAMRPVMCDAQSDATVARETVLSFTVAAVLLREHQQWPGQAGVDDATILLNIAQSPTRAPDVRQSAIQALGLLRVLEKAPAIRALAEKPEETPAPVLQAVCMALWRIDPEAAETVSIRVLEQAKDISAYEAAAQVLGRLRTPNGLSALVRQAKRFPASGAAAANIPPMLDTALAILEDRDDPLLRDAIEATQYLWRPGARERCMMKLCVLAKEGSQEVATLAADRIIQNSSTLPLTEEQTELRALLSSIRDRTDLDEIKRRIDERLSVPAPPASTDAAPVSTAQPVASDE